MKFYLEDERHTLASALRPVLEEMCPDDFVAVTLFHPLDNFICIDAPSASVVREALLMVRETVRRTRTELKAPRS